MAKKGLRNVTTHWSKEKKKKTEQTFVLNENPLLDVWFGNLIVSIDWNLLNKLKEQTWLTVY